MQDDDAYKCLNRLADETMGSVAASAFLVIAFSPPLLAVGCFAEGSWLGGIFFSIVSLLELSYFSRRQSK